MAPEETSSFDPENGPPARQRGTGDLPELRAPAARLSCDEPLSGPVSLADLDPDAAKDALADPFALAASLYPKVEAEPIAALVAAAINRIDARADAGVDEAISAAELAAVAGIDNVEDLLASPLGEFAQLVVRGVFAQAGNMVFYEQLESHSAATGRRHNGEGSEKVPGIAEPQLHLLEHSAAGSNRHCSLGGLPLNMGTRWARSCDRFGFDFPAWARQRAESFSDEFAEHMHVALVRDRAVRARVVDGLKKDRARLAGQITGKRLLAAISQYLLIGPIPFGTSLVPYRTHHAVFMPGRDPATVEEAIASHRSVALACGQPSPEERLAFEEDSEVLHSGQLPSMYELGIHRIPAVQYRWSPSRHELARYTAGEGARMDIWRLVGVEEEEDFWRTVTMIERHAQIAWTGECTDRFENDCMPGKVQVHLPERCAGMRALLAMANAGIVDALRQTGPGRG